MVWYSEGDYMVKVENKETLRLLTKRFMKMNRARNIIAVIAIMLTSLLFFIPFPYCNGTVCDIGWLLNYL